VLIFQESVVVTSHRDVTYDTFSACRALLSFSNEEIAHERNLEVPQALFILRLAEESRDSIEAFAS